MLSYYYYIREKVERFANENGFIAYAHEDCANCGWWIFVNKKRKAVRKVHYSFQSGYGWITNGKGAVTGGKRFEYGNDEQEQSAIRFAVIGG